MKKSTCLRWLGGLGLLISTLLTAVFAQEATQPADGSGHDDREAAILATVDQFVAAYNAHDAKAVAELFLPQAQVVDENDITIQGRVDIEALFVSVFEKSPEAVIEVNVESVRFIGTSLAIETGVTNTVHPDGVAPEHGQYSVVHVLQDEKWLMGLVRDIPARPTHRDHLQTLAWLVGDWVDESREGIVNTSCNWSDNDSFLLQEIAVHQAGRQEMTISQRIGWDPLTKHIKTWVFDSEGGYGESTWTPTDTGWLIKATSVNSDGSTTSATSHIEPTGMDRYVFRSVDRVVAGELLPPVEVVVVRRPPQPTK